jgi:hypothetical protein
MVSPRALALVLLSALGTVTPARADRGSYHATVGGDVAFTDNVFSTQRDRIEGDLFFQVRPGLLFSYGIPRIIQDLSFEAEVTQYALHSEEASLAGRGTYRVFFLTGPRSELLFQANGGTGRLSSLGARTTPDQVTIELQPPGNPQFISADASEYGSWVASRHYRLSERIFARASQTDDNNPEFETIINAAEAGASIGIERRFKQSSLSLDVGGSALRLERVAAVGAVIPSRLDQQLNPRVRMAYRRDIDRKLSANLDGGLVYVIPFGKDPYNPDDPPRRRGIFPVLGGQLAYTDVFGVSTLSLRRDVSPNLLIAQNTVSDVAVISAAVPIPWREDNRRRAPKLIALGSLAAMRTQLVDPVTSDLSRSFGVGRVDVGIQYSVRPGFSYTIRYELMVQSSNRDETTEMITPGFFRNTFYFSFKYRWPEEVAIAVPKRRGQAVRADAGDASPLGAEPVIPDLLEEEEGEGGER